MKLLSVPTARAIWLFDILDLNPKGESIFPDLFELLQAAYHFKKFPKSIDERDGQGGWAFTQGKFQVSEETFKAVDFAIYNDGIVATTQSTTDDTEMFLGDLLELVRREFGLTFDPSMIRRKMYVSEMNVQMSGSLGHINPKLEEFASKISSVLGLQTELGFEVTGIAFSADPTAMPASKMLYSGFAFERKVGAPFSEDRFYTKAPLPTTKHLELLDELEKLLL